MNTVPSEFWYASTLILAGILVWLMKEAIGWMKENFKELRKSVDELTKIVLLHDEQIKQLQTRRRVK